MTIEAIAKVCHETNRAYCEVIGDSSQLPWDQAPDWQRQSAVSGVQFHLDNPAAGESGSHDNWMREKLADGWTYGPVKNPEAKQHPCIVPYSELPEAQRLKDSLFVAVVHALKPSKPAATVFHQPHSELGKLLLVLVREVGAVNPQAFAGIHVNGALMVADCVR